MQAPDITVNLESLLQVDASYDRNGTAGPFSFDQDTTYGLKSVTWGPTTVTDTLNFPTGTSSLPTFPSPLSLAAPCCVTLRLCCFPRTSQFSSGLDNFQI